MIDQKDLVKGKKYVITMVCCVRPLVAECVDFDRYDRGMVRVLNKGFPADILLKRDDYFATEEYDPSKHGEIE